MRGEEEGVKAIVLEKVAAARRGKEEPRADLCTKLAWLNRIAILLYC
jgi:hypothetical protein